MQILALNSEETNSIQFKHQCLQFRHMYNNQMAIERNQVVIDGCNYQMWSQMKILMFENLKMFASLERKMERQFNAIADIYIALAALANRDPSTLVTREEMVDRLKTEDDSEMFQRAFGPDEPIGHYLKLLKQSSVPKAFPDDMERATEDALNEIKTRLDRLKIGEDFRLVQDAIPLEGTVPERGLDSKGLFQTLLDDVLDKVTNQPAAQYDFREKIKEIKAMKAKRPPTPAACDTCLEHPAHYDATKDCWDKEKRQVSVLDERGVAGEFERVTLTEHGLSDISLEELDEEPPIKIVGTSTPANVAASATDAFDIETDSDGSLKFVSTNKMSSKYDLRAKISEKHDLKAIAKAKRDGWYDATLVPGAPDVLPMYDFSIRPIRRSEVQTPNPTFTVTRAGARGSSEDFESDQELFKKEVRDHEANLNPIQKKLDNKKKKKSVQDRLGPIVTGPGGVPLPTMSGPKAGAGKSVNDRLGARTAPVKQASISDYVVKTKPKKK